MRPRLPDSFAALAIAALLALAVKAPSQQLNGPFAALSVNGTARFDPATGTTRTSSSQIVPPPPGGGPVYHHRTSPRVGLELRIQGNPGRPVALMGSYAPLASPAIPLGGDLFELDPNMTAVLIDGTNAGNFYNFGATISALGYWNIILPQGIPHPFLPIHLQGIVFDPTAPPFGIRMTGTVTVEVDPGIETLARNFADGLDQVGENPNYLFTTLSVGFLDTGLNAGTFVANALAEKNGLLEGEPPLRTRFVGLEPNATNAPALPTGLPAAGQTELTALRLAKDYGDYCGLTQRSLTQTHYDLRVKEQLGYWKIDGNRRDLNVEVVLIYANPAAAAATAPDASIRFRAEDLTGIHGGIATASVSGPQLAAVNGSDQATSTAFGTVALMQNGNGNGGGAHRRTVHFGAAGTSRLPWVELPTGPRDVYSVTVNWVDGTVSGPYSIPIRAAIDVAAQPAAGLAAIPARGLPFTATLSQAGTPAATTTITFNVGSFPVPSLVTAAEVGFEQNDLEFPFDFLNPTGSPTVTLSFCTPDLATGQATDIGFSRADVFGTEYASAVTLTF